MNKQQLASKIWQSANKMRSKTEANEYKDYIPREVFRRFGLSFTTPNHWNNSRYKLKISDNSSK